MSRSLSLGLLLALLISIAAGVYQRFGRADGRTPLEHFLDLFAGYNALLESTIEHDAPTAEAISAARKALSRCDVRRVPEPHRRDLESAREALNELTGFAADRPSTHSMLLRLASTSYAFLPAIGHLNLGPGVAAAAGHAELESTLDSVRSAARRAYFASEFNLESAAEIRPAVRLWIELLVAFAGVHEERDYVAQIALMQTDLDRDELSPTEKRALRVLVDELRTYSRTLEDSAQRQRVLAAFAWVLHTLEIDIPEVSAALAALNPELVERLAPLAAP